jgi:hypothetical protein
MSRFPLVVLLLRSSPPLGSRGYPRPQAQGLDPKSMLVVKGPSSTAKFPPLTCTTILAAGRISHA